MFSESGYCSKSGKCPKSVGRIKIFKYFVHNPNLKELNELRTRISFFLKLDNGKSGL